MNMIPASVTGGILKKILLFVLASILAALTVTALSGLWNTIPKNLSLLKKMPVTGVPVDTIPPKDIWTTDQVPQQKMTCPAFGPVQLYGNSSNPAAFIVFFSGDGGMDVHSVAMAKSIAEDGRTLVAAVDINKYYKKLQATTRECLYPAGDVENGSEFIQKSLHLPEYLKPVLVGYSSGATLSYALLCQAPAGTFKGGIGLGFCPEVELNKPFCEGSGKFTMTRRKDGKAFDFNERPVPAATFEVLHGTSDQDCLCQNTLDFFDQVKNVKVLALPKVGHGFAVTKSWLPQFKQALFNIGTTSTGMLSNGRNATTLAGVGNGATINEGEALPLYFMEAVPDNATPMVLFLSGDGGWTGFDQQICKYLTDKHIPVVGLNAQSYFWKKKTPKQTVTDLVPVLRQYLKTWNKSKILLVGYSFGANVTPFVLNRLPDDLREKAQDIVLISPDPKGDFEIHIAGMLGKGGGPYDVAAEVRSLQNAHILCISGDQEGNEMQTALQGATNVRFEKIPGSHHYNNDAAKVAETVLSVK